MTDLAERLRAVEDRLALLELEGAYARTWDAADAEGWAGLFTPDGVFEMAALGERPGARLEGHHRLREFCRDVNTQFQGLHTLHLPTLAVDGDRATGSLHFEFHSGRSTPQAREVASVTGLYEVRYRRTDAGWRIEHRFERATSRSSHVFHPGFYPASGVGQVQG